MKLLGSTKKDVDSDKKSENVPKLESVEVVLVPCNLVKNDYQNSSKVLFSIHKDIFACLFSIHNTISLSCHEQVCLSGLRFERYFSHHWAASGSRNVAHLNILVHDSFI